MCTHSVMESQIGQYLNNANDPFCSMCKTARSQNGSESQDVHQPIVKRSKIGVGMKLTRDVREESESHS